MSETSASGTDFCCDTEGGSRSGLISSAESAVSALSAHATSPGTPLHSASAARCICNGGEREGSIGQV
eukprot:5641437-Pyramimonas_sp.AAC.1